jgi:uncharacterized protein (TIGR04255 family)
MSKLPNAPLVEVVFELRWSVNDKSDLMEAEYLYGDIYAEIKNKYPHRERILPIEIPVELTINKPVYRYRANKNDYPLVQVGPGLLTLNTTANLYEWNFFFNDAKELIKTFLKIFKPKKEKKINLSLLYLDFFPFDFKNEDVTKFINENLNIKIEQSFIENVRYPKEINIAYSFDIEHGELKVSLQKGINNSKNEGLLLQSRINGAPIQPENDLITEWINNSHGICSNLFKELTKGQLYESFKQ